ncbi:hypothetical protein TESG_04959 [Trichophyton tonsurans CBS 112818]|uniref:Uncharacterized protein n=1 Tax=Trichophyton tonsurans (strain CBS 112818) TaxID=647933 RepID=F2S1V3_TRIT1|nr:hypothetical protein TESG_04959 [Trichophyton tonsurans CBS 112818]
MSKIKLATLLPLLPSGPRIAIWYGISLFLYKKANNPPAISTPTKRGQKEPPSNTPRNQMERKIPLDCPILVPESTFTGKITPRPHNFAYMWSWAKIIWGDDLMKVTAEKEEKSQQEIGPGGPKDQNEAVESGLKAGLKTI